MRHKKKPLTVDQKLLLTGLILETVKWLLDRLLFGQV
ncbi:MAG: hypothetical protein Ta2A_09130 [Treponemataceae bacterium]|nr:MAG: hypothetical protein Ta2A_09130 [Treponemataceae bacterium]